MANEKQEKENQKKESKGTPYDDAFRALYIRCKTLVLFLLNEAFGTEYIGDEELQFLPNETFRWRKKDSKDEDKDLDMVKRISDSQFEVTDHNGNVRRFQVECQSKNDSYMAMRIMEYSLSFALETGTADNAKFTAEIHNVAVLYLRSSKNTPNSYEMEVVAPTKESIYWTVPVVKVSNYTLDDLFSKKLYFLLPFYIFNFEGQLKKMETDEKERRVLTDMLADMKGKILELDENGALASVDIFSILDVCWYVADNLLTDYQNVRKEVENIMAGKDYRTRSMIAYDEGLQLGREEGREEGEFGIVLEAINDGLFSIDYLESKKKWSKDKIRRFLQFQSEQQAASI